MEIIFAAPENIWSGFLNLISEKTPTFMRRKK